MKRDEVESKARMCSRWLESDYTFARLRVDALFLSTMIAHFLTTSQNVFFYSAGLTSRASSCTKLKSISQSIAQWNLSINAFVNTTFGGTS